VMAILAADHKIGDNEAFNRCLHTALETAEKSDSLGIIGIEPSWPNTNLGYIEVEAESENAQGNPTYRVLQFREKPHIELAEQFLASNNCYWNCGYFFWRLSNFLDEAKRANTILADTVYEMADAMRKGDDERAKAAFLELDNKPIDISLIERASQIIMTPGGFAWDDIGSWDSYHRSMPSDKRGNVAIGNPVLVDTEDCIVYNERGAEETAVAVIGVRGLAVVVAEDAVLVMPKGRSADVRRAVEELRKRGSKHL